MVYLAREQESGRLVAFKVLRPALAESLSADRFLREIRVTQQLAHPHIASVLDSGVARALESAGDTTTSTGVVRGTPA